MLRCANIFKREMRSPRKRHSSVFPFLTKRKKLKINKKNKRCRSWFVVSWLVSQFFVFISFLFLCALYLFYVYIAFLVTNNENLSSHEERPDAHLRGPLLGLRNTWYSTNRNHHRYALLPVIFCIVFYSYVYTATLANNGEVCCMQKGILIMVGGYVYYGCIKEPDCLLEIGSFFNEPVRRHNGVLPIQTENWRCSMSTKIVSFSMVLPSAVLTFKFRVYFSQLKAQI